MESIDHDLMRKGLEAPTSTESLDAMVQFHSGVFDDVVSSQLDGWGASDFLVHSDPILTYFTIVAEFRSGSGNMFDRQYAANALRTWHELAAEVICLRTMEEDAARIVEGLRRCDLHPCGCTDEQRCDLHAALDTYHKHRKEHEP